MLLCLTFLLVAISFHPGCSGGCLAPEPGYDFVPAMKNLDIKQVLGKWWIHKEFDSFWSSESFKCDVIQIDKSYGNVIVHENYIPNANKPKIHITTWWSLRPNKASGEVSNMVAGTYRFWSGFTAYPFDIVATDYKNFLYVNIKKPNKSEFDYPIPSAPALRHGGVVFTRKMAPTQEETIEIANKVAKAIESLKYKQAFLSAKTIDNTECS